MTASKHTKTKAQTHEQELYKISSLIWDILIYLKPSQRITLALLSEIMIAICMEEGISKANVMQVMDEMWGRAEARRAALDLWGEKLKECNK